MGAPSEKVADCLDCAKEGLYYGLEHVEDEDKKDLMVKALRLIQTAIRED